MKLRALATAFCLVAPLVSARAEEGMWLFNAPPREALRTAYGFELSDAWLDHLMRSSVRFNSGGSGAFVGADGLVVTNHHVGADTLQKISTPEKNLLRDGFYARARSDEIPAVDLELNVLQSIEDVTARVNAAVPADAPAGDAAFARNRAIIAIEKESLDRTGLRSDVVTLYQGGAYHLYRYKRYTDIRLVFAPHAQAAFFGGDPDNFEYPRHDLDVCFFRVYEDGRPARPAHFLNWSKGGAAPGELVFVSGHPGRTNRLITVAELAALRDRVLPFHLASLKRREVLLSAWSERSEENARRAAKDLFSIRNARKAVDGRIAALQDPAFFAQKVAAETAFKKRLAALPDSADALAAFDRIAAAQIALDAIFVRHRLLESADAFSSASFAIARALLRAGDERPKADGDRLPEFSEARRTSLELELFSEKPVYTDYEILDLGGSLSDLVAQLGADDSLVCSLLDGMSPRARASRLVNDTRVRDVAFRRALYQGGAPAVASAADPMIEFARLVDTAARASRDAYEDQIELKKQAHAVLDRARFSLDGAAGYPDATFTLRLSYGTVKGYDEAGAHIPAATTFADLYRLNAAQKNRPPYDLPRVWLDRKTMVAPKVPLNFATTNDIVSGNSGSPVVNRAAELVGLIFDGNLQSLAADYAYTDAQARALVVHGAGTVEALRKIYDAAPLADELVPTSTAK